MLVRYTVNIIGSLVLMFILKPSLTGVLLSVVPIISIGAVQYGKLQRLTTAKSGCPRRSYKVL